MDTVHILVTGAAGQIGYILSHSIASGCLFNDKKIILHLCDIPECYDKLIGIQMEIIDSAYPTCNEVIITSEIEIAFKDLDYAFLVASAPLPKSGIRSEMLKNNVKIMKKHGEALSMYSKKSVKVIVIGNPVNTNTLIAIKAAKNLKPENFQALCMLDHTRSISFISNKLKVPLKDINNVWVWGNHNDTMVPDLSNSTVILNNKEEKIYDLLGEDFCQNEFVSKIRKRGLEILTARGKTSAMSPTAAAILQMKAWIYGTNIPLSFGIYSKQNDYNIPDDLVSSFPCTISKDGKIEIVKGLKLNQWTKDQIQKSVEDLINEKKIAEETLFELYNN